jgi:hypothetical protein
MYYIMKSYKYVVPIHKIKTKKNYAEIKDSLNKMIIMVEDLKIWGIRANKSNDKLTFFPLHKDNVGNVYPYKFVKGKYIRKRPVLSPDKYNPEVWDQASLKGKVKMYTISKGFFTHDPLNKRTVLNN